MQAKKTDRRVKYTKMVLKESFIELLETKGISQITIKEICECADINRSTFYSHYYDQYDLMKKIQNELLENVEIYLSAYIENGSSVISVHMIERIFEYIKDNARICRLLLSEQGDINFQKRIMMLVYEKNINELTKSGTISQSEAEYIYSFMLTGCIGIIQKWLNSGMSKSPRFMAELVIKITTALLGEKAKEPSRAKL